MTRHGLPLMLLATAMVSALCGATLAPEPLQPNLSSSGKLASTTTGSGKIPRQPIDNSKANWLLPSPILFPKIPSQPTLDLLSNVQTIHLGTSLEITLEAEGLHAGANGKALLNRLDFTGMTHVQVSCGYLDPCSEYVIYLSSPLHEEPLEIGCFTTSAIGMGRSNLWIKNDLKDLSMVVVSNDGSMAMTTTARKLRQLRMLVVLGEEASEE